MAYECLMCGYSGPAVQDWGDGYLCRGCADDAEAASVAVFETRARVLDTWPHGRPHTTDMARVLKSMADAE